MCASERARKRENATEKRASAIELSDFLLIPELAPHLASWHLSAPAPAMSAHETAHPGVWEETDFLGTETTLGKPSAQGPDSQVVFSFPSYSVSSWCLRPGLVRRQTVTG